VLQWSEGPVLVGRQGELMKVSDEEFDAIVQRAVRRIPDEIRRHLDNIIITVRKRPTTAMLRDLGVEYDDDLLGLFQGVPLTERSVTAPPLFPDTIYVFQEPLENMCESVEELEEEIEVTVVHEVAHYIGMDEQRLIELGYD
jgi:predicted Zn-dependent protease with MMP-like domain